jgi:trehalose 6-phosphate synthase
LLVNPHDIEGLKEAILTAIAMPKRERRSRMRAMRKRVLHNDVARWSNHFLSTLEQARLARSNRITPIKLAGDGEWTVERREAPGPHG